MLVWLGRRTVQNMVIRIVTRRIGSDQYTLLFGRPVQTGQVLFELKFTTAQSAPLPSRLPSMGFKVTVPVFQVIIFHYENIPFLICIQMVGGVGGWSFLTLFLEIFFGIGIFKYFVLGPCGRGVSKVTNFGSGKSILNSRIISPSPYTLPSPFPKFSLLKRPIKLSELINTDLSLIFCMKA